MDEDKSNNFHEWMGRTHGVANIDVVGTIIGAYTVSRVLNTNFIITLGAAFVIGHGVHIYMKQETALTKLLEKN